MQVVKADQPVNPTIKPFAAQTTRGKVWAILPWVIFGIACVLVVVGLIVHYADGLDDDMAGELGLAKLLSEGKGFIITNQWYYTTEIRFLNTQLIFTPLFWLFNSWAVVRIVGTLILNGIMLAAFYFLLASLQRKNLFPWLATLLLLPVAYQQIMLINYGAYYTPHLAISFTVLGLTFYALRVTATKKRNWLMAGAAVLSFMAAVGGFRQVMLLSLPLFVAAVIYWRINLNTEHKSTALRLLVTATIALGGAAVGLLINVTILQNCFSFQETLTSLSWGHFTWSQIESTLNCILATLGWHTGILWGTDTFGNLVAMMMVGLFIIATVDIIKHRTNYANGVVMMTLFALCALAAYLSVFLLTNMVNTVRYALPVTVFILPVIGFYLTQNWSWQVVTAKLKAYVKPLLGVVALTLVLINGVFVSCQFYYVNAFQSHNAERNAALRTIGEELLTAECVQGYYVGTRGMDQPGSGALTELTNGALEIWTLCGGATDFDRMDHYLQPTAHDYTRPAGKVFLIVDAEASEWPLVKKIAKGDTLAAYRIHADGYFTVYVCDNVDTFLAVADIELDS